MTTDELITELKYVGSIIGYFCIVYPLRRFIIPFCQWVEKNIDMFIFILAVYTGLYLYDFDYQRIATELTDKLLTNDIWFLRWVVTPLTTIAGVEITPFTLLIVFLGIMIIERFLLLIKILFTEIKRVFGDVLIAILWCYYTLAGDTENSVLLITKDEAKTKAYMYLILGVVIIVTILLMVAPNLIFDPFQVPEYIVIVNETITIPTGV